MMSTILFWLSSSNRSSMSSIAVLKSAVDEGRMLRMERSSPLVSSLGRLASRSFSSRREKAAGLYVWVSSCFSSGLGFPLRYLVTCIL
jgi:hypothetical protein